MQVALFTSDDHASTITRWLADEGHLVFAVDSTDALAPLLEQRTVDVIIADGPSAQRVDAETVSRYRCITLGEDIEGWQTLTVPLRRRVGLAAMSGSGNECS